VPRFEERLFAELVERHGALLAGPAPRVAPVRRRVSRAPVAAVASGLAAALAVLAIVLSTGGGPPAFAVVQHPDGTVSVTIREVVGVRGADERLMALGVPVRVAVARADCRVRPGRYTPARVDSQAPPFFELRGPPGHASAVIDPRRIPPGDTVLLGARAAAKGVVALSVSVFKGPVPPCVRLGPGR
jgi:hypothetical protein